MSRLFAVARTVEEIAKHFHVDVSSSVSVQSETIEGSPGLIIIEKDGLRLLKSVSWGFPRQTQEMQLNGEPPGRIGLVADLTNPLWDRIVIDPRYRCLIPITHFANPDGPKGRKTRAWFSNIKEPLIAWAGFCGVQSPVSFEADTARDAASTPASAGHQQSSGRLLNAPRPVARSMSIRRRPPEA